MKPDAAAASLPLVWMDDIWLRLDDGRMASLAKGSRDVTSLACRRGSPAAIDHDR